MTSAAAGTRRRLAAGITSAAVLLAALDAYVVVTIFSEIMADLSIPFERPERATPIVTAYLLGYVAAMPLLGQLSDRIGRRTVIQGCLLAFAAGSVISAASGSLAVLVAGRLIQGAAGGALLPVTFAVISDHWETRGRTVPLGLVGAAQELGSVIGPLYGAAVAVAVGWQGVFWINVPLAVLAMAAVHRALPPGDRRADLRLDLVGGMLLGLTLAALIVGLYNPDSSTQVLPDWGPMLLAVAACGAVALVAWERRSSARLLDPTGLKVRALSATAGCSLLTGVALMATLVDIPLLAQTLLGEDTLGGALILSRFLAALAIGALVGGLAARRIPMHVVAFAGCALAAGAYWLISRWPAGIAGIRYPLGALALPRMDADLVLAGLGLGLVIAPLAAAALQASDERQHGVASATVVVARMMGMLVGIAALGAVGVYRFGMLTKDLVPPLPFGMPAAEFARASAEYERAVQAALRTEYSEIFAITALVCMAAAALALLIKPDSPKPRAKLAA